MKVKFPNNLVRKMTLTIINLKNKLILGANLPFLAANSARTLMNCKVLTVLMS